MLTDIAYLSCMYHAMYCIRYISLYKTKVTFLGFKLKKKHFKIQVLQEVSPSTNNSLSRAHDSLPPRYSAAVSRYCRDYILVHSYYQYLREQLQPRNRNGLDTALVPKSRTALRSRIVALMKQITPTRMRRLSATITINNAQPHEFRLRAGVSERRGKARANLPDRPHVN